MRTFSWHGLARRKLVVVVAVVGLFAALIVPAAFAGGTTHGRYTVTNGTFNDPPFLDARREEHRALERLGQAAREIVGREGVGASAVDRATETLRAASLTDEGRELLKRGRLTKELQPPGFEALTGLVAATSRQSRTQQQTARKRDDRAERRREVTEIRERVRQLRAQERELVGAARTARREAERTETEAAKLRGRAEEAEAAVEAAASSRAAAEHELERLR